MAAPRATTSDKAFGVTHIKSYIPITLDMQKMNYDAWRELFETHCLTFGVSGHIDGTSLPPTPDDTPWKETDGLVKMWIYGTISTSLLDTVLKNKCTARDLWTTIENLFRDNKEARAIQLDHELRSFTIGDLSVHDYCQKLKSLSDLLANVDSPVSERALVMHMLNGLCDKFDYIINVIKHRNPFPTFTVARSMLLMEEERLKKQTKKLVHQPANSSSPNILYAGQPSIDYGHQQQQSYQNNNNRNNNGRGRGRGRNSNTRGRGRYQQNWNHGSNLHSTGLNNHNSNGSHSHGATMLLLLIMLPHPSQLVLGYLVRSHNRLLHQLSSRKTFNLRRSRRLLKTHSVQ